MVQYKYVDWPGLQYYHSKVSELINSKLCTCIRFGGEVLFEDLQSPDTPDLNIIYRVVNDFTIKIDNDWFDHSLWNNTYPAGTILQVVQTEDGIVYKVFLQPSVKHEGNFDGVTDLSNYYTIEEVNEKIVEALQSYATINFVRSEIAKIDPSASIDLSSYYTKTEVDALIPDVSNFITSIPDEYVTETELANKGYLTEHQDLSEYVKIDQVNELESSVTILQTTVENNSASIEGLSDQINDNSTALRLMDENITSLENDVLDIKSIDHTSFVKTEALTTALSSKANTVPFTEDYVVTTAIGGFEKNESLKNMTVAQILTKLFDAVKADAPEIPEGSSELIESIVTGAAPIYTYDTTGNLTEVPFEFTTWSTEDGAKQRDGETTFYQLVNSDGTVVESGYQVATTYNEVDWLTVVLPQAITNIKVKMYDPDCNNWVEMNWNVEPSEEQTLEGYTIWTVPEQYEVQAGDTYRFVIIE